MKEYLKRLIWFITQRISKRDSK